MGDRIHDELGRVVESYVPSPGLPRQIEARTRQRARRQRSATVGVVVALVVASGVAALAARGRGTTTVASLSPSTAASTVSPVTGPPTTIVPAAVAPPSFLAAVGAGNEQAVVVDTATGHVVRPITAAPSGQYLWALSPDGRTLYATTQQASGCGRSYQAIDIATGVSRGLAWGTISDLVTIAPAPDGQTVAYIAGCAPEPSVSDAFIRRPDGTVTALATGGPAIQLSWSHDGTMLALDVGDTVQIWAVGPTSVTGPQIVSAPDPGCSLALPRFAGNGLFAVEQCPGQVPQTSAPVTLRLVLLDSKTGAEQRSWPLASAPYADVADLAVDPTGGWALYSYGNATVNGQVSLLALAPATAKPRVVLGDAFEVAWLPASP